MVSLDIKKAFDSVSHESVRRALRRVGVPDYLFRYISSTLNDSVTSFSVGSSTSRVVQINRGVRQGDLLSPFLFNLVLDELLVRLESHVSNGCPFRDGTRCRVLAFADDLVVVGENVADLKLLLQDIVSFFGRRGMALHPDKCRVLVKKRNPDGAIIPLSKPGVQIYGRELSSVSDINPMQYLGYSFDTYGVRKPNLTNCNVWLQRLAALPLKPLQKMTLLRVHLLPRLLHFLMSPRTPASTLKNIDKVTRHYVKRMLHLHLHTPDNLIHRR